MFEFVKLTVRYLKETVYYYSHEYLCTTDNKNFKCVFLKKYFILQYYYLFLYYYYFMIFCFLYYSISCKYEYFCTTGNKNFKRVFLKSIFFKLADGISHVLVDRLTWNLEEIFTECTFIAWTTEFKIWCSFLFFFYHSKDEKHKENRYFNFKMLPFF